jgi:hypothetical protein
VLVAATSLAAACTSQGSTPSGRQSPSPTPTVSATTPAGEALGRLAALASRSAYHAAYLARQHKPRSTARWQVWHSKNALRVDVVEGRVTATLIVTRRAAYSCSRSRHRRICFRVASGGKPVPAPFNSAPQALFTTDLRALAGATASYRVRAAGAVDGSPARPDATCFSIHPTGRSPKPRVAVGVYCFATSTGVLTSVHYPSGNTVLLTSVHMAAPQPKLFHPYSSPTPVPG